MRTRFGGRLDEQRRLALDTATERARAIVRDRQDLTLSRDAYERFLAELDAPATAVPELTKLFRDNPALPPQ